MGDDGAILDLLPDVVVTMRADGTIGYANAALERVLGWHPDDIVGRSGFDFVHPDERDEAVERIATQLVSGDDLRRHHLRVARRDGGFTKFEMLVTAAAGDGGELTLVLRDVTEREEAQFRLHRSDEQLRALTENIPDALARYDAAGRRRLATQSLVDLERDHGPLDAAWDETVRNVLATGTTIEHERQLGDGGRWLDVRFVPEFAVDGRTVTHVLVIATDITDRKRYELQLARDAAVDELTGLPNRRQFRDEAARILQRCAGIGAALLFVDLDGFKAINDQHGHRAGDAVLIEVARRLRSQARPGDLVARLGGDEFVVLCPDVAQTDHAQAIAARLLAALDRPVTAGDVDVAARASIGIALAPAGAPKVDDLLHRADTAMYEAKSQGGSRAAASA